MSAASWRFRRAFWIAFQSLMSRAAKPLVVPVPPAADPPIAPVPFTEMYPRVPIAGLVVADHAPKDEFRLVVLLAKKLELWLDTVVSPMQPGLPEVDADPYRALERACPPPYRRLYPMPVRPPGYDGGVDLGYLAVASPYACYLEVGDDGVPVWDVGSLDGFEMHPGLVSPAARVQFAVDEARRRLRAVRIDSALGSCQPTDAGWDGAVRLAMCGVSTHLSLVRHFNWVHLVCAGPLAIVTHNRLPGRHPIRRLLQPHVYCTHFGNQIVTIDQMEVGGDFENMFSYTHAGMCALFEATAPGFDLRMIEPDLDAQRRGIAGLPVDMPALDNRRALMQTIRDHVVRYLALYFDSDAALASDGPYGEWVRDLSEHVAGVREIAGTPFTLEGAVLLLSTIVYMTTVEHEIIDSGPWDYQLWNDVQPVRVAEDGRRPPLDVYQRLVNWNFSLNVHRTPLMSDFTGLALDARGADAFRQFRDDLGDLQRRMNAEPGGPWRMEPRFLKANINY